MNIQDAIKRVIERQDLKQEQARIVMEQIMSGLATDAQIGSYVTALRMKGETVDEIAGSAQAMRDKALMVSAPGTVVDTCGTGGDSSGTFNISTTAAFVVAAHGITVAKHGNRSISSNCGSADVLKALGVCIDAKLPVVERCLKDVGIGFLFAPQHHGAMRHAAGPRKEMGIRTLFNLLGPLTNPASAPYQLVGVFDEVWVEPLAYVLARLGVKRALVVHGMDGLDEITTTNRTRVAELKENGGVVTYMVEPEQFGLQRASLDDLRGGDVELNATITRNVLAGEKGAKRDIVVLNAGAAITVARGAENISQGIEIAQTVIDDGRALRCLEQLIEVSNQT